MNQGPTVTQGTPILLVQGVGEALARKGEAGVTVLEIHQSFSPELAIAHPVESLVAYLEESLQRGEVQVNHGSNTWSFTALGAKIHADLGKLLMEFPEKMRTGEIAAT
jgi:hypothetical protein